MLIKKEEFPGVSSFCKYQNQLFAVTNNKVINLTKDQIVKEFENPVGSIVYNEKALFISDWYRNAFMVIDDTVTSLPNPAVVGYGKYYLEGLANKEGTILKSIEGESLWRSELLIPSNAIIQDGKVLFLNAKIRKNKSITCVSFRTGEIIWENFLNSLIELKGHNGKFGSVIGISDSLVYLALRDPVQIITLSLESGEWVSAIPDRFISAFLNSGLDVENFKLLSESRLLIHPYLEFDLEKEQIIDRTTTIKASNKYVPSIFSFLVSENYIWYGDQNENQVIDEASICHLNCLDRRKGEIVYTELINDKHPEAGIKQIYHDHQNLIVLDSMGILGVYDLEDRN